MTATAPTSLLLPADHDEDTMPAGIRPSTTCWTRKVIELVDDSRYLFHEKGSGEVVKFDRGIGQRGNDIEALVLGRKFGLTPSAVGRILLNPHERLQRARLSCGGRVATQVPIVFHGGVSHIDWVIPASPEEWKVGSWELKSGEWDLPQDEHYEVVHLRQVLAAEAGMDLPQPWKLLLVDPKWYRVRGPFTVTTSTVMRSEIEDNLARVRVLLEHLDQVDLTDQDAFHGLECSCGLCFEPKGLAISEGMDALLRAYADAAEVVEESQTEDVRDAIEQMSVLKDEIRKLVGAGEKHTSSCGWQARTTAPKPKLKVAWDKATKAGLLQRVIGEVEFEALLAELEAEGYADRDAVANPSLYVERTQ